ncbi:hypothetical protein JL101_035965 (plasmid) [Skermanella rosea]|uniref:hypothetical protein n=1 Tax=Skermanella rosea TaxID=1817965 RepID=UPI001932515E|nr:hypothetical protein [Skermanella rosea]UEM08050.1 hypothetical protein JL101_035965 [Skermanella rosea]
MTSTSAASALHGGNWVSKPYLIAAHAVACMASLPLMGTAWYWAPAGLLPSAIFWLLYRTSRQARAELTAIRLPSARTFMRCAISYAVPLAVTSALCTTLFAYAGAWTWLWSVAALWLTMAAPYLAVRTFNHSTRIGRKLRAREIASHARRGHTDRILDGRRCTELITGLAPCGAAIALTLHAIRCAVGAIPN